MTFTVASGDWVLPGLGLVVDSWFAALRMGTGIFLVPPGEDINA